MTDFSAIYAIKNTSNGKYYIGQSIHVTRRRREHLTELVAGRHWNKHLQAAWNKYGAESFEFRVLEECPTGLLDSRERLWIAFYRSVELGYNMDSGGTAGKVVSPESRARISAAAKGQAKSPTHRARIAAANIGKVMSPAIRLKLSEAGKGRVNSPETRARISAATKGRVLSAEHKARIGAANKGKARSPELRARLSAANKGRVQSAETRARRSESLKRAWAKRLASTSCGSALIMNQREGTSV